MPDPEITKAIKIKVKDKDGKKKDVDIKVDEKKDEGEIKVGKKKQKLKKLKKSKDGHKITGRFKHWFFGWIKVTITINCKAKPPTIRIVAVHEKTGKTVKDVTYTLTHAEQDRLIRWIKGLKIGTLVAPGHESAFFDATPQPLLALSRIFDLVSQVRISLIRGEETWLQTEEGLDYISDVAGARAVIRPVWTDEAVRETAAPDAIALVLQSLTSEADGEMTTADPLLVSPPPLPPLPAVEPFTIAEREQAERVPELAKLLVIVERERAAIIDTREMVREIRFDETLIHKAWGVYAEGIYATFLERGPDNGDSADDGEGGDGLRFRPDEEPLDWWSIVHFSSGFLLGLLGLDFWAALRLLIWWEVVEPDSWPSWLESRENQLTDIFIGMVGWGLARGLQDALVLTDKSERDAFVEDWFGSTFTPPGTADGPDVAGL